MSIKATIFVEILPKDLGKEVKPNKNLIYKKGLPFESIDNHARVAEEEVDKFPAILLDKKFIGIYHHWDGEPQGVGRSLIKNFNTYKEALNLMLYGGESWITGGSVRPYMLRSGKYISDDKNENGNLPMLEDEIPTDLAFSCWSDYVYLFANGEWLWSSAFDHDSNGYEWQPLRESITIFDEIDAGIALVAYQQRHQKVLTCPRCGRNNMHYSKKKGTFGVLSRVGEIYICDKCGEAEELENNSVIPKLPLIEWDWFKGLKKNQAFLKIKRYMRKRDRRTKR